MEIEKLDEKELNRLIASKIFNYIVTVTSDNEFFLQKKDGSSFPVPDYCNNIELCDNILKNLKRKGIEFIINMSLEDKFYWLITIKNKEKKMEFRSSESLAKSVVISVLKFFENDDSIDQRVDTNIINLDFSNNE